MFANVLVLVDIEKDITLLDVLGWCVLLDIRIMNVDFQHSTILFAKPKNSYL